MLATLNVLTFTLLFMKWNQFKIAGLFFYQILLAIGVSFFQVFKVAPP